jgi:hypothetical protein
VVVFSVRVPAVVAGGSAIAGRNVLANESGVAAGVIAVRGLEIGCRPHPRSPNARARTTSASSYVVDGTLVPSPPPPAKRFGLRLHHRSAHQVQAQTAAPGSDRQRREDMKVKYKETARVGLR